VAEASGGRSTRPMRWHAVHSTRNSPRNAKVAAPKGPAGGG
jgi:hypothetical protein